VRYFVGFVSPNSAEANNGCGKRLNSHLIASCIRNIAVKNYQNLIILLQVTTENVRDVFPDTMYFRFRSSFVFFVESEIMFAFSRPLCSKMRSYRKKERHQVTVCRWAREQTQFTSVDLRHPGLRPISWRHVDQWTISAQMARRLTNVYWDTGSRGGGNVRIFVQGGNESPVVTTILLKC